ncbi:MAG TPA: hypothetical protein VLA21_06945 [Candidatus Limnocylindria bacterium]|nr:hypothetical protein [Candidatus Limnocylindria bacterium]
MTVGEMTRTGMGLRELCAYVRENGRDGGGECRRLIYSAMQQHPHAPHPHNLIGILLEQEGNHPAAMKHFRAAWALDPTYMPARWNLDSFGTFFSRGRYAYDESDCPGQGPRGWGVRAGNAAAD